VFVRYFAVVDRQFDDVVSEFEKGAFSWVASIAGAADDTGGRLLAELGFEVASRRIARRIDVRLGDAVRQPRVILVPIEWRAARAAALFPELSGVIEIAGIGPRTTQVGLSGSYDPPFGLAGKLADRALMHRVAELTVKNFVDAVARRLSDINQPV
jgi:hypothetical protein